VADGRLDFPLLQSCRLQLIWSRRR
jgi:hypothetical protein